MHLQLLYSSHLLSFTTAEYQEPLYSIITYAVGLKAVDFIVEGFDRAKCAMIITEKPDEVCEALTSTFDEAKGGYSDADKTLVYFVVNRFQVTRMKDIVHDIDTHAYITITEVADVFKSNHNKNS